MSPISSGRTGRSAEFGTAVRHYFANRVIMKQRELRRLLRRGRTSLLVGTRFLVTCLGISGLLAALGQGAVAFIVRESLTIGGWVAVCARWKSTFTTGGPPAKSAVFSSASPGCPRASKAARAS